MFSSMQIKFSHFMLELGSAVLKESCCAAFSKLCRLPGLTFSAVTVELGCVCRCAFDEVL